MCDIESCHFAEINIHKLLLSLHCPGQPAAYRIIGCDQDSPLRDMTGYELLISYLMTQRYCFDLCQRMVS